MIIGKTIPSNNDFFKNFLFNFDFYFFFKYENQVKFFENAIKETVWEEISYHIISLNLINNE